MMNQSTIQATPGVKVLPIEPCIIVIDRIRIDRAVSYEKEDLGTRINDDGSEDAEWHTRRHYRDRKETEEAQKIYNKIRYRLGTVCAKTDIGFVCPRSKVSELNDIIIESEQEAREANSRFKHCKVKFRIVCTELASNNESGMDALKDAIIDQTNVLKRALADFDPKKARDAIRASKSFADMIADPKVKMSLQTLHKEAKDLATEISKTVRECGSVANAVASPEGQKIMHRAKAAWNVF
jgi:hypothetical protein